MRPYQHADGKNLAPLLNGSGVVDRDAIYRHYPHDNEHPQSFSACVIHAGDWTRIEAEPLSTRPSGDENIKGHSRGGLPCGR